MHNADQKDKLTTQDKAELIEYGFQEPKSGTNKWYNCRLLVEFNKYRIFYTTSILSISLAFLTFMFSMLDSDKDKEEKILAGITLLSIILGIYFARKQLNEESKKAKIIESIQDVTSKNYTVTTQNHSLLNDLAIDSNLPNNFSKELFGSSDEKIQLWEDTLAYFSGAAQDALCNVYNRKFKEAKVILEEQNMPADARSFIVAQMAYFEHQYKKAADYLKPALESTQLTRFLEPRRLMGKILLEQACSMSPTESKQSLFNQALDAFEFVIQNTNQSRLRGAACNDKGRAYIRLYSSLKCHTKAINKKIDDTLEWAALYFSKASRYYPNLEWSYNNLGATMWYQAKYLDSDDAITKENYYHEALGYYQRAIRICIANDPTDKKSAISRFCLAVFHYNCGDVYYELMQLCRTANDSRGKTYYELGLYFCNKSIEYDSEYIPAYSNKAKFLIDLKNYREAKDTLTTTEKLLDKFLEKSLDNPQNIWRESHTHISLYDTACETYELHLDLLIKLFNLDNHNSIDTNDIDLLEEGVTKWMTHKDNQRKEKFITRADNFKKDILKTSHSSSHSFLTLV